jgi:ribosomal protein S18 acetylase RimI-like enzyme
MRSLASMTPSSSSSSSAPPNVVTIKRQPPNPSRPNLIRLVALLNDDDDGEKEVAHCVVWEKKRTKRNDDATKKTTATKKALFVSSLAVDEKFRRRGIASQLLDEVERLVKESEDSDLDSVELTVNGWNASAIALYEKRGFEALEEEDGDAVRKMIELAKDPQRLVQKRMAMDVR